MPKMQIRALSQEAINDLLQANRRLIELQAERDQALRAVEAAVDQGMALADKCRALELENQQLTVENARLIQERGELCSHIRNIADYVNLCQMPDTQSHANHYRYIEVKLLKLSNNLLEKKP